MNKFSSSNALKYISIVLSAVWVWSVYGYTLGFGAVGIANLFLSRTYEWIMYMMLSILCSIVFGYLLCMHRQRYLYYLGLFVASATIIFQILSPIGISTDYYRYIWQGRVSNMGMDNYTLRPWDAGVEPANTELFDRMDWRDKKSVYPPLAEAYFGLNAKIFDANILRNQSFDSRLSASKIPNIVLFLLCGYLMYLLTKNKYLGLLWLANPFLQLELINSAHIDVLSIALVLLTLLTLKSKRPIAHMLSGALIAAAGMVKLTPFLLVVPVLGYIISQFGMRRASLALGAFFGVIAATVRPFLVDNLALVHRIIYWLSGKEFSGGNPLYTSTVHLPGIFGVVLRLSGIFFAGYIVYRLLRIVQCKEFSYQYMLKYIFLLSVVPFFSAPIVLPWYWVAPLTFLLVAKSVSGHPHRMKHYLVLSAAIGLLVLQYVDRAVDTDIKIRQWVVFVASLLFYSAITVYISRMTKTRCKSEAEHIPAY